MREGVVADDTEPYRSSVIQSVKVGPRYVVVTPIVSLSSSTYGSCGSLRTGRFRNRCGSKLFERLHHSDERGAG